MSSDEDFSVVMDTTPSPLCEDTVEGIQGVTANYKRKYEQLQQEQKELVTARDDSRTMTEQCRRRSDKLAEAMKQDEQSYKDQLEIQKMKLNKLKQEESDLMREIQKVEDALREEQTTYNHLKQQTDVFTAVPEKNLVFNGLTENAANTDKFEMKARIVYPMNGGTALVTFEEEDVAKNILQLKKHQVDLGDECRITLEASPVHLMLPSLVEIDTEVCPRRILVSNLPKVDTDTMLNRLEIHFSKTKNGGGEVEMCEMMPDSGTVVVTFMGEHVAKGLTEKEYHDVEIQKKKYRVRVTPFLNGNITNLKTKMSMCRRTVLLTGIPDVMERDSLQDMLEIHFQKNSNGGGEIEAFLYNPLGEHTGALFEDVAPDTEK
ncbi:interferon-induced 35 kDa protein homolog [Anabas testudineus]|uniref:RRM domain-containing protein n=1 Tax=Anabas testudineus TaxID=64144 RepID=A0A3Q1JB22_ANATE|nr:interferon-induced 35 kDa protein homolog [Anabas testudineus]XP_026222613.1 interferon-induced 35 kDa protein homolog [Anabas testudineus]